MLTDLILTTVYGRDFYYSHFIDADTEDERSNLSKFIQLVSGGVWADVGISIARY